MKPLQSITLVDAGFEHGSPHYLQLHSFINEVKALGITVSHFEIESSKIIPCTGCWGCWVKSPGQCLFADATQEIRSSAIQSDLLILASPLLMGYPKAQLKHVMDKMIPLIMPYIELVNNENHHEKRYDSYPRLGFIYGPEEDTDREDLSILRDLYARFALNFKSELSYFESVETAHQILQEREFEHTLNVALA